MGANYEVWLDDPIGTRLKLCDQFEKLEYTRVVNGIGTCVLTVGKEFDHTLFRVDGLIEVWRQPEGGALALENSFFIRMIERGMDANDKVYTKVTAFDPNELLGRRIVGYAAGTAEACKLAVPGGTLFADDVMKEFVDENLGNAASNAAARDIETPLNFSIQVNLSAGPNITGIEAPWENLYDVIKKLADTTASFTAFNPVFFDVVATAPNSFEFRTFTNQRGADRSWPAGNNPVILSAEFGNLRTPKIVKDYRNEVNVAYAGGKGEGAARPIRTWVDQVRVDGSVWNRRESFKSASSCDTTACIDALSQQELEGGRPLRTFTCELVDTPGTRYGLNLGFGDRLSAVFEGEWFDVYVDVIKVAKAGSGAENISARLGTRDTSVST